MTFAFDQYELDSGRAELRRGGEIVPVEPQVFALLELLVSARDRVVTREEIFERIWANRIVSDAALASRIRDARRAIGDDGSAQRLIRTVHRRGLRFVGDVRERLEAEAEKASPAPPVAAGSDFERPAVAVLPVDDPGRAKDLDTGALTDALAAALGACRIFPIASRATAERLRDSGPGGMAAIGAETGTRYVVSAVTRASDSGIRIRAEVTDIEADRLVWSGRVERERGALVDAEDELAAQIALLTMPEMEGAEARRALRKPDNALTPWELAMRAARLIHSGVASGFGEAERLAAEAADRAPDWVLPYSLIAVARFQRAMRGFSAADSRVAFADTLDAARRALEIDDRAWIAHALCGVGELWTNHNHERALLHVNRAIQLNPAASMNYHFGGCIAGFSGDLDTARRHGERLFRMDSVYPYTAVIEADLGLWHMLDDRDAEAEERLVRAHRWDPGYGRALQRMISLYGLRGDRDRALQAARKLSDLGLPLKLDAIAASYPFRCDEHRERFLEGLKRSGVNF